MEKMSETPDDLVEWVEVDGIKYRVQQEVAHALAAENGIALA